MFRYYTIHTEGHFMVWEPGESPDLWRNPDQSTPKSAPFLGSIPMVYVPWEVVETLNS